MSCQETRQKLSSYADNALRADEREQVQSHVACCASCRLELEEQGALDMLLKNSLTIEPSPEYLDSFWPSVAEKLDGAPTSEDRPPHGGGNPFMSDHEGEGLVFKSTPAMQILSIPERAQPQITSRAEEAPPPAGASWRWPFAFVLSTAILVGGFIYFKKISAPPATEMVAAQSTIAANNEPSHTSAGTAVKQDAGLKVAMATPLEAGANVEPSDPSATVESSKSGPTARARRSKDHGDVSAATSETKAEGKPSEGHAKAEPPKESATKPEKKGDELDNLIDSAIGSAEPAKKKAEQPAPVAPASDLPSQLTINQIQDGMRKIKGQVQSCYDQFQVEGLALVTVVISSDGSVTEASIKGKFFGTDTGTCVVNAVKKAHFASFSGKEMKIPSYPFRLQ
jgi:hypothetical protein